MRMLCVLGLLTVFPISSIASEPPTKDEVAALVKQLKDSDFSKRSKASRALESLDPAAKDAIPVLIEALKDRQPEFNIAPPVARALGRLGKSAVPALTE